MPEPRAQRTLVKSPPEIWSEVSDAATLARHLGEFGEIRITEVKAETTVVWEGDTARGTVRLEPSGWGTRVTITAEAVEPEPVAIEPEPEPVAIEPEPVADAEPVAEEPTPEPVAATTAPAPRRRGFFARLFGRKAQPIAPEPVHEPTLQPVAVEPEPLPVEPEPLPVEPEPEPVAAEAPPIVEPVLDGEIVTTAMDPERIEAVLVGVLDDLGSAHHRPFSRG